MYTWHRFTPFVTIIVYTMEGGVGMIFDWDEHNEDHIAKHNVAPYEAEEVFFDPKRLQLPAYNTPQEKLYAYLGCNRR